LHIGEQEPLEFHEGLLEKDHIIHISCRDPASPQAKINCVLRELVVVFLPCKPLLLGSSDELAIAEKRRCGIVEVAGNAKNMYQDCLLACSIAAPFLSSLSPQPRVGLGLIANGSLRQQVAMASGPRIRK
jgi:hypothetical protein